MKTLARTLSVMFLASLLTLTACSKKDGAAGAGGLANSTILESLPDSTVGFAVIDSHADAYKAFRKTAMGQAGVTKALEFLETAKTQDTEGTFKPFIEALEKSNLLVKPGEEDKIEQLAVYLSVAPDKELLGAGMVVNVNNQVKLADTLAAFKSAFDLKKFETAPLTLGDAQGFSLKIPPSEENPNGTDTELFVASRENRLSFATTKGLAAAPFRAITEQKPDAGVAGLRNSENFKKAIARIKSQDSEMAFAYLDISKPLSMFDSIASLVGAQPEAELVREVPLESMVYSRTFGKSLSDNLIVSIAPKNDSQKSMIQKISAPRAKRLIDSVPAGLSVLLSLDGRALSSMLEMAAAQASTPEEKAGLEQVLEYGKSVSEYAVAFRNAGTASPFPELGIVLQSDDAAKLQGVLKEQVNSAMAMGMGGGELQQKQINGLNADYMITPFGVGFFMVADKSKVTITSSEAFATDLSKASSGGLTAELSEGSRELAEQQNSLLAFYANAERIAQTIEQAQGSLAMFTGGQNPVSAEQIAEIRKFGTVLVSTQLTPESFELRSNYDLPAVPAK